MYQLLCTSSFRSKVLNLWHVGVSSPAQGIIYDYLVLIKILLNASVPCPLLNLGEAAASMNDLCNDFHGRIE